MAIRRRIQSLPAAGSDKDAEIADDQDRHNDSGSERPTRTLEQEPISNRQPAVNPVLASRHRHRDRHRWALIRRRRRPACTLLSRRMLTANSRATNAIDAVRATCGGANRCARRRTTADVGQFPHDPENGMSGLCVCPQTSSGSHR